MRYDYAASRAAQLQAEARQRQADIDANPLSTTNTRRFEGMTAQQVKEQWMKESPEGFDAPDPTDPFTGNAGMTLEELKQKADAQLRAAAQPAIDNARLANAMTFMHYTPTWHKTPENAAALIAELDARRQLGTVSEMQAAFADLVAQKKVTTLPPPLPQPRRILTEQEQREMPLDQLRDYLQTASANGLI